MTLSEKRRSLDMSLGECARLVNMSTSELSKIERASKEPSVEELSAIGKVLGWTAEEVRSSLPSAEEVKENAQRWSDAVLAMEACHKEAKSRGFGKGHAGHGDIECPVCKGRLRFSVAAVNGHLWGACATATCVRWMQ